MRGTALQIVKGSRRHGRCGHCQREITWATLAARGSKNIPLVYAPVILREQTGDNSVVAEVLGFDQIHRCPERKTAPRSTARTATPARPHSDHVFPAFTSAHIEQLRQQVDAPKPPAPAPETRRLW